MRLLKKIIVLFATITVSVFICKGENRGCWTDGRNGSAIKCNGAFIEISPSANLKTEQQLSVEMWIKPDIISECVKDYSGIVISKLPLSWRIAQKLDKIEILFQNGENKKLLNMPCSFKVGQWVFISVTYDGSEIKLYIDGKLIAKSAKDFQAISNSASPICIGKWTDSSPRYFCGTIDEVKLYNRELTESEIQKHFQDNGTDTNGLILYFPLDEGDGNIVYDKSGNQNNGTIKGNPEMVKNMLSNELLKSLASIKKNFDATTSRFFSLQELSAEMKTEINEQITEIKPKLSQTEILIANLKKPLSDDDFKTLYTRLKTDIAEISSETEMLKCSLNRLSVIQEYLKNSAPPDTPYAICIKTAMEKIYRDGYELTYSGSPASLALCKNEHEGVQVVILPIKNKIKNFRVSVSDLISTDKTSKISSSDIKIFFVGYIGVRKGGYGGGYTFKIEDESNHNKIEFLPDPLLEKKSIDIGKDSVQAVWIDIYATKETNAGNYGGVITLEADDCLPQQISITARIYDFAIPSEHSFPTHFQIAPDNVAELLAEHRISTGHPAHFQLPNGELDFSAVKSIIDKRLSKYFKWGNEQFSIEMPVSDLVHPPVNSPASKKVTAFTDKQKEYIQKYYMDFANYLKEKNILNKSYVVVSDEPKKENLPDVIELCKLIKKANPEIRTQTISNSDIPDELTKLVDIWTVQIDAYDTYKDKLKKLRAQGKEVWLDVTCNPPHQYPNFSFIDKEHSLVGVRILTGTLLWEYKIQGFFYWWTCARQGAFMQDVNNTECYWQDWKSKWPAGDGLLTYPAEGGYGKYEGKVLPSIRLEAIRDGLEDFEYIILLKEKISALKKLNPDKYKDIISESEALLNIPPCIIKSLTKYTDSPYDISKYRASIATQIEKMNLILKSSSATLIK